MTKLQPVRGTHDLLPDDFARHKAVIDAVREQTRRYGFAEMATPIFEFTEVFARGMGESSDVVSKEMYSFMDRGGESITLRPEYTAGIVRAFISNGLAQQTPFKAFAHGPMFRYERPQKGRQRQFHQFDVEVIGASEPEADIEVVTLAADILRALGVADHCQLEVNSLGDAESRLRYRTLLVDFLEGHKNSLSEESRKRLAVNPMRILDSKDDGDRAIVANAPSIRQAMNAKSQDFFACVLDGLDRAGVAYQINERLVRGLDYYTHTAFEFTTTALGAQGTVIGGGRYDGLVEMLGGPHAPGIGFGGGIERLAMLIDAPAPPPGPIALIPIGEEAEQAAHDLARRLRQAGHAVEVAYKGNVGKRMKRADKLSASHAVIFGDEELRRGAAQLKTLSTGAQEEIALDRLLDHPALRAARG